MKFYTRRESLTSGPDALAVTDTGPALIRSLGVGARGPRGGGSGAVWWGGAMGWAGVGAGAGRSGTSGLFTAVTRRGGLESSATRAAPGTCKAWLRPL